jgi:hypothetical protein
MTNSTDSLPGRDTQARYFVCDGRIAVGTVERVGELFIAITAIDETTIGTFPSLREAAASFGEPPR